MRSDIRGREREKMKIFLFAFTDNQFTAADNEEHTVVSILAEPT